MKKSLTKRERIKKYNDFKSIFKRAKRTDVKGLKILFIENSLTWNRIAIITGRGYKLSVLRNKAKRQVRDIYRNLKHTIRKGYDIIFIPYNDDYSYKDRFIQIHKALLLSGILL